MDINVLKRKNLIAVYLVFEDGYKKQLKVNVHFLDKEICYLETELWDNFKKPRKNQKAEIHTYTMNGIYIGKTKFIDTTMTLQKVIFTLIIPQKWEYTQTRSSIRKHAALPFSIKYNDGYEVKGETSDISSGGISFALDEPILPLYYRFNADISIDIPNNGLDDSKTMCIKSETRFLREQEQDKKVLYIYRFINMDSHNLNILKLFLSAK